MAKRKMKMKFNAIVAPLRKLLEKLEEYMIDCAEAQKANDVAIQNLVDESELIAQESTKSAATAKQLKVMLGDEVEVTDSVDEDADEDV